ncbi:MAG TPA: RNA methyltransferase [Bacteroidetes bacterium]|nr:putative tRNA/rRNA methyltransferase [bacterium BMS3Bbin04]HDO65380.1 RNA methyltransferase [Bacteroidota bacterium]HEX04505.1 RNA methyltransferase [Bacteroidota bacterium]
MYQRRGVARAARWAKPDQSGPPSPDLYWRRDHDVRLDNVAVILVEPARPENVGAAARAMKTMGLQRLIVVGSDCWRSGKARALAVGAGELLEAVEEYATLAEAVEEMTAVAITTARRRRRTRPVHPVESVVPHLLSLARTGPVAIVFGREEWGLRNEELLLGDIWTTIPMATAYPSLNLAQSIMLVCHEIAKASTGPMPDYPWQPAAKGERQRLIDHATRTMLKAGLYPRPDVEGYQMVLGRVLDRALLEDRDVQVLHGIFHQMDVYMHQHELKSQE